MSEISFQKYCRELRVKPTDILYHISLDLTKHRNGKRLAKKDVSTAIKMSGFVRGSVIRMS